MVFSSSSPCAHDNCDDKEVTDSAPTADGGDSDIFRARFNVIAAIFVWILCAAAVVSVFATYANSNALVFLAPIAVVAYLDWMILLRPTVRVDDTGVRLVNVTKTVDVPWEALIQVDTRYSLTLRTPHGNYAATAAPAPGRVNMTFARSEMPGGRAKVRSMARPSDSTRTDSGAAAYLVRDRWTRLSEADRIELGVAETTPVDQTWHWKSLVLCAILVVGSLIVLALG